jgi:hypothetical protein
MEATKPFYASLHRFIASGPSFGKEQILAIMLSNPGQKMMLQISTELV